LRTTSRDTVDGDRPNRHAISRNESPATIPREISSRSANDSRNDDRFGSGFGGRWIAITARRIA
jgi:hypothetical protein